MRSFFCTRFHRRFIIRYFGSLRNLVLWIVAVSLTVYAVDSFLFSSYSDSLDLPITDDVNSPVKMIQESKSVAEASSQHLMPSASRPADSIVPASNSASTTNLAKSVCSEQPECPAGEYSYFIQSGFERTGSPTICFNGHYAFSKEKNNGKRGFNMLIINGKTFQVEDVRQFDTYEDDSILLRYLRLGMEDGHILMLATQDDATTSLKDDSKKWLKVFGSSVIDTLQFRDAFVLLGQRGLVQPGTAIEKVATRHQSKDFPDVVEVKGCAKFPLGELKPADQLLKTESQSADTSSVKVASGEKMSNCGVPKACDADSIAVHLFSGKENVAGPRMCIEGVYVFDANVNNAGRGINMAIYDVPTGKVVQTSRFDTYESIDDVAALVKLIKGLSDSQLVISVSHDDMYTALKDDAKDALESIGSSYSKQLAFRDAWALVGRSGIKGYSPIEEIEFGGPDVWPSPIDKRICIPKSLQGGAKKMDVEQKKNAPKRVFCRKYDGYEEFCKGSRLDEHLTPAPLVDTSLSDNPVFKIPIVVIPGLSHIATLQQFEALLAIPGIDPKQVTVFRRIKDRWDAVQDLKFPFKKVMYDMKFEESGLLADFFGYSKVQLQSSTKYIYLIEKALEEIWKSNSDAKYVILLEEEVIPTIDLLNYFAQCLPALDMDDTLVGATAWNENGFDTVSTMPSLVYRGNTFPGLGLLLKKTYYVNNMKDKMKFCCLRRSWYGWFEGLQDVKQEVIIPDVSRVTRRQFMGLTENVDYVRAYFSRPRLATSASVKLENVDLLVSDRYDVHIDKLIAHGTPLVKASACLDGRNSPGDVMPNEKGKMFVIFFEQDDSKDEEALWRLARCFGLFYAKGHHVKGLHAGTLRFTFKENHVFFVGSASPFYTHKPPSYEPVKKPLP